MRRGQWGKAPLVLLRESVEHILDGWSVDDGGRRMSGRHVLLPEHIAAEFGTSKETERRKIKQGVYGPPIRAGRSWAVRRITFEKTLERWEREAAPRAPREESADPEVTAFLKRKPRDQRGRFQTGADR